MVYFYVLPGEQWTSERRKRKRKINKARFEVYWFLFNAYLIRNTVHLFGRMWSSNGWPGPWRRILSCFIEFCARSIPWPEAVQEADGKLCRENAICPESGRNCCEKNYLNNGIIKIIREWRWRQMILIWWVSRVTMTIMMGQLWGHFWANNNKLCTKVVMGI